MRRYVDAAEKDRKEVAPSQAVRPTAPQADASLMRDAYFAMGGSPTKLRPPDRPARPESEYGNTRGSLPATAALFRGCLRGSFVLVECFLLSSVCTVWYIVVPSISAVTVVHDVLAEA